MVPSTLPSEMLSILFLFVISLFGILLVLIGYPLLLILVARWRPNPHRVDATHTPSVALIIACHNPGPLLAEKISNSLALDYPEERLSILIVSDGSTDGTAEALQRLASDRVQGIALERHDGKAAALNAALEQATRDRTRDLLVFTDVDARLPANALRKLTRHFADPSVGGVSGQRVLTQGQAALHDAQASYVSWDSRIKMLESKIGSTTSNDGKLYALRREAAAPIADGVTDDLYAALGAITQGWRFIFDGEAYASVPTPAVSPRHEIIRRRRIVLGSLYGLYLFRQVLNPFHYGFYAIAMIINKVLRRVLPFLFMTLFMSNLVLMLNWASYAGLLTIQLALLSLGILGASAPSLPGKLGRLSRHAYFAILGMLGTSLGVFDFLRGRTVTKWEPLKNTPKQKILTP